MNPWFTISFIESLTGISNDRVADLRWSRCAAGVVYYNAAVSSTSWRAWPPQQPNPMACSMLAARCSCPRANHKLATLQATAAYVPTHRALADARR